MKQSDNATLSIWLQRAIVGWLFVFALFAPHSIAVAQGAWLIGMALWVVRLMVAPRPEGRRTPVDYALLGFFILSALSAVVSYEPMVSIGKMRAASLFTIVYLFVENIPTQKIVRALALIIIASCLINVFYTAVTRVVGRGVKVEGVKAESPLAAATLSVQRQAPKPFPIVNGDTVLEVDGHQVRTTEEVAALINASSSSRLATVKIYRGDTYPPLQVPRGRLLAGTTATDQLGISRGHIGRDWRASGFYGHYVTYAEALQLIASLGLGLFICLPLKKSRIGVALLVALAGILFALLLTVTRASWLAFLISATVIILLGTSRRTMIIAVACAIPLVLAGALLLQQKRHVGLIDQQDASTTWRETVWHEGFDLLISKPRHLLVGVGMDSIKTHWREWGLFDRGNIPLGHMHSNPLEIALERGVPALIVWLVLLAIYARTLWHTFWKLTKKAIEESKPGRPAAIPAPAGRQAHHLPALGDWLERSEWIDRGIVLGAMGGLAGFFSSGLVHYNWGDSEVVMIFYFVMGLSLFVWTRNK
jgi:O-antigen ligase